ncbi:hypothetical protein Ae505Ps2_4058c [Pseudonocardia sp. Ae505_Ps2]|nr:hypothetical protein Ae505Ps2_4058c [Pseudonocardia sp. Ae505_Ps2]
MPYVRAARFRPTSSGTSHRLVVACRWRTSRGAGLCPAP